MSWTTIAGHRPTGPVQYNNIHIGEASPVQKCSCGEWYCYEHIRQLLDGTD